MRHFITAILLFLTSHLFSQGPFEFKKVVDEFTEEVSYQTNWMRLNDPVWQKGPISWLKFNLVEDKYILELKTSTLSNVFTVDQGDLFYIKMANGDMIKLESQESAITAPKAGAVNIRGKDAIGIHLFFMMSRSDIEKLSDSQIDKCRLDANEGKLEIEPETKKYKKELQENWVKIYNALPKS